MRVYLYVPDNLLIGAPNVNIKEKLSYVFRKKTYSLPFLSKKSSREAGFSFATDLPRAARCDNSTARPAEHDEMNSLDSVHGRIYNKLGSEDSNSRKCSISVAGRIEGSTERDDVSKVTTTRCRYRGRPTPRRNGFGISALPNNEAVLCFFLRSC